MPEGHVIHRLARDINNNFAGHHVRVTSPQGRFATEAAQLDGCELTQAVAVGKHLFICFDAPWAIHIHLGLVGKFHFTHGEPRGVVRLRIGLEDTDTYADLKGPQWCRLITAASIPDIADTLGADPILGGPPERRDVVLQQVARSKRTAASVLMDQKLFAGVGNIYRAETLFRLGIDPMTPSREIDAPTWRDIWDDLETLMRAGVDAGRIDTVRPEHTPDAMGRPPRKDDHGGEVYVYRRAGDPCYICGTPIEHSVIEGRNLFWCPTCQH